MKKLVFAFCLAFFAAQVSAREVVTIYYAFSPADTMANYSRTLVEEANKIQDKYTFLFDTKPGAGNVVAANHVKNTPNSILATSSAFFIRPIFYPNESYQVSDFKELLPQCDAPMGVASLKYKSWKDVPTDRPITIGVSGLGVTTHLVALQLSSKFPNLQIVPFKSTNDSILATVSGQIDMTMGFLNDEIKWTTPDTKADKRLTILGITGDKSIKGIPTLVGEGFSKTLINLNAPHHLVVPDTISNEKFKEWREILFNASKAKSVQASYAVDYAVPLDSISNSNIQPWYNKQNTLWKKLSSEVELKK